MELLLEPLKELLIYHFTEVRSMASRLVPSQLRICLPSLLLDKLRLPVFRSLSGSQQALLRASDNQLLRLLDQLLALRSHLEPHFHTLACRDQ